MTPEYYNYLDESALMEDSSPMTTPIHKDKKKRPVTVFLSLEDYDKLAQVCTANGISRADFLRSALAVHPRIPMINTRPLSGACLQRHKARLAREMRAARNRDKGRKS